MERKKNIFITGITGNQGNAIANHLLVQNYAVIGLTRNANSAKAKHLKEKGVTVIEGNMNNPESYKPHLDKADAIYLVQSLQRKDKEIIQGKRFIDAINPDNKSHLVYGSVLGADLETSIPHFESKFELENYIKSKNLIYSIIRPASFYENHLFPRVASDIKKGKYFSPLNETCKQQMIGVDDIGKIVSVIISNKIKYTNKTISLATDQWKIGDLPQVFSEALSKAVTYKKLPGFIARLVMGKNLSKMFQYMNQHDFCVINNIQDLREEFDITGDFKSWVNKNFKPTSGS